MKRILPGPAIPRSAFIIAILVFTVFQSQGQQTRPVDSGYAAGNGVKVYYEVYGAGRPLILLHGAFMTITGNWGALIPELSKTRQVIAIELQGHGHTPFSERKLDFGSLAQDVEAVMDHLKVDSADVAGYSLGGEVAYKLAIQSPKRIRKLVIISSTYKTSGWMPEVSNAFKGMKPEFLANTPMKAAYDAVAPDTSKWTKFVEQLIAFAQTAFDFGDANVSKMTMPVLIIAGDNDGLDKIALMKTYRLLGGAVFADFTGLPKSQLAIVPAQGHVSLMMQTNTILRYLEGFLK